MLSKILSKDDCAQCRFCCSFRRCSLWETPVFSFAEKSCLEKKYPKAKFKTCADKSFTIDIDDCYKSSDENEEVPCPFLDPSCGCVLSSEEKPFDCMIWPFRISKVNNEHFVVLERTCPVINKIPLEKVSSVVDDDFIMLAKKKVKENCGIVKEWRESFVIIKKLF